MSRYLLELARPEDDAALRGVLARTPTDGAVALSFRREPSFFDAAIVDGHMRQVIVGRDREANDLVVGLGSRSIRRAYINGVKSSVGYLSSLRLLPEYRARAGLIARGYRYFRALHADGLAPLYLTTIAAENHRALGALVGGRAGLPDYHFAGQYVTAAIPLARRRDDAHLAGERWNKTHSNRAMNALTIAPAGEVELDEVAAFLAREGPARQFFPVYGHDEVHGGGALRGLHARDIMLARRDSNIVAMLAAWDQHDFRQTVIHGYGAPMRLARPIYNGFAGLRGLPRLPAPGAPLRHLTGALPIAAAGEHDAFAALLRAVLAARAGGAAEFLTLGLYEQDPLLAAARASGALRRAKWYVTNLYYACWEDGEALRAGLDARPPYLELGSL